MDVWVSNNYRSEVDSALLAFGSRFVWSLLDGPVKELSEPIKTVTVYENNKAVDGLLQIKPLANNQFEVLCAYPSDYSLAPAYNVTVQ